MDAKRCDFVFAPIFLALFLLFASQTGALSYKNIVADSCKQDNDARFCITTLLADPKILMATNVNAVAKVGLEIAKQKTLATSQFFNALSQQNGIDGAYKPALQTCATQFKEAAIFFESRVIGSGTASLDVHYGLDNCQICETELGKAKITIESALGAVAEWKKIFNVAYATVVSSEASGGNDY